MILHNKCQLQFEFLKSGMGRPLTTAQCQENGQAVATEMSGIPDAVGSQILTATSDGPGLGASIFSPVLFSSISVFGDSVQFASFCQEFQNECSLTANARVWAC
jgi:hypothetical protein